MVVNRIILVFSVVFPLFFERLVLSFEYVIKMEKQLIANKLKDARIASGLTQKEVALSIGRPQQTIAAWETARSQPDADTLYSLLVLYNVSPNTFFGYDVMSMDVSTEERELIFTYRKLDDFAKQLLCTVAREEARRFDTPNKNNVIEFSKPTSLDDEGSDNFIYFPLSEQDASAGTGTYLGPEAFRNIKVADNEKTRRAAFAVRVKGDSMEPIYCDGDIVMISRERPGVGDIALVTMDGCGYIKRLGMGTLVSENKKYKPIPLDSDNVIVNGRAVGILQPEWILEM